MTTTTFTCRRCDATADADDVPDGWWTLTRAWEPDTRTLGLLCSATCLVEIVSAPDSPIVAADRILVTPATSTRRLSGRVRCAGCNGVFEHAATRSPRGWYHVYRRQTPLGRACSLECLLKLLPAAFTRARNQDASAGDSAPPDRRRGARQTPSEFRKARRRFAARVSTKERQCVEKHTYGERAAHRAARILRDKGDPVHAYPCPFGAHWHVGTTAYHDTP